jgi:hypothetical protein
MGADIHLFSEKKRSINGEDKWVNTDYWSINPYFGEDDSEVELELVSLYNNRNYELFNILAGVRGNGPSISQPRGLPDDVSSIVKKESDRWDGDGHSHSYFTLEELKNYFKNNSYKFHNGFLNKRQIEELDEDNHTPYNWVEWSEPDLEYREWKEISPLKIVIDKVDERMRKEFWVREGDEDTSELDKKFRIVFWFDN